MRIISKDKLYVSDIHPMIALSFIIENNMKIIGFRFKGNEIYYTSNIYGKFNSSINL